MVLREGHGTGIEPAVDDLGRALHRAAALALEGAAIDVRAVQFDVAFDAALLFQFRLAADDVYLAALFAYPNGQRRTPVAVAREPPVDDVFEEVAHAPRFDGFGHPVDGIVGFDEFVLDSRDLDEPALAGVVQERRVAPPAVRIAVFVHEFLEQQPLLFEHGDDALVRFFDERTREIGDGRLEAAALVHHVDDGQTVLLSDAVVVLAEGGRDVYDARAVRQRDVPVAHDVVRLFAVAALRIREERLVFGVFVVLALFDGQRFIRPLFKQRGNERLRQNVVRAVLRLDFDVVLGGVHTQRHVGRERPRRGRPREEIAVFQALALETDKDGGLLDILVPLRDLVRGERGAAARAVRNDLMPLVQEPLLPNFFERPPDRLDILVVVGDVRVLHVRPVADALGHFLPFALVFPDAFLALFDERLDAVLFDVLLAVHAEELFHLQLDGQAVRIPTRLSEDVFALHRLIAGDDVLHHAREDMPDMRLAVRRRGAVVEGELLPSLVFFDAVFKDAVLVPEIDDFLLAADEIHRGIDLGIHFLLFIHAFSPCGIAYKINKDPLVFGNKRAHQNILTYAPVGNAVEITARGATLQNFARRTERGYPIAPCPPLFTCRGSLWSGIAKGLSFVIACIYIAVIVTGIAAFVKRFHPPRPEFSAEDGGLPHY